MKNAFSAIYPEKALGGFSRFDISVLFYNLIRGVINEDSIVVDLGAGRGEQIDRATHNFMRDIHLVKGKCQKLIGLDVDDAVLSNPYVDEAYVYEVDAPLPLEDESVDVVFADWVVEHVEFPDRFANEIARVLKPGGWFPRPDAQQMGHNWHRWEGNAEFHARANTITPATKPRRAGYFSNLSPAELQRSDQTPFFFKPVEKLQLQSRI